MTSLFGPQRFCLRSGYTSSITECLKHNKLVWIEGKVVHHISEPSASDHDWAFSEMASFLRLALAELSVEFPSFEVTQAFRVFDVSSGNKHWSIDNPDVQADLARLAKVFQVDWKILPTSLNVPVAESLLRQRLRSQTRLHGPLCAGICNLGDQVGAWMACSR